MSSAPAPLVTPIKRTFQDLSKAEYFNIGNYVGSYGDHVRVQELPDGQVRITVAQTGREMSVEELLQRCQRRRNNLST